MRCYALLCSLLASFLVRVCFSSHLFSSSFFSDLAPGLVQKYPNMEMQVEIDADSRPFLATAKTDNGDEVALKASLPLRMFFQVVRGAEGNVNA